MTAHFCQQVPPTGGGARFVGPERGWSHARLLLGRWLSAVCALTRHSVSAVCCGVLNALLARGFGSWSTVFPRWEGCPLGGGTCNGPGTYGFSAWRRLRAYFAGSHESKVSGPLRRLACDPLHECCKNTGASILGLRFRHVAPHVLLQFSQAVVGVSCCGQSCVATSRVAWLKHISSCLRMLHSGHMLCSVVMCVSFWDPTCHCNSRSLSLLYAWLSF